MSTVSRYNNPIAKRILCLLKEVNIDPSATNFATGDGEEKVYCLCSHEHHLLLLNYIASHALCRATSALASLGGRSLCIATPGFSVFDAGLKADKNENRLVAHAAYDVLHTELQKMDEIGGVDSTIEYICVMNELSTELSSHAKSILIDKVEQSLSMDQIVSQRY